MSPPTIRTQRSTRTRSSSNGQPETSAEQPGRRSDGRGQSHGAWSDRRTATRPNSAPTAATTGRNAGTSSLPGSAKRDTHGLQVPQTEPVSTPRAASTHPPRPLVDDGPEHHATWPARRRATSSPNRSLASSAEQPTLTQHRQLTAFSASPASPAPHTLRHRSALVPRTTARRSLLTGFSHLQSRHTACIKMASPKTPHERPPKRRPAPLREVGGLSAILALLESWQRGRLCSPEKRVMVVHHPWVQIPYSPQIEEGHPCRGGLLRVLGRSFSAFP